MIDENEMMEHAISIAKGSINSQLRPHSQGCAKTQYEVDVAEAYGAFEWLLEKDKDPAWAQFLKEALNECINKGES